MPRKDKASRHEYYRKYYLKNRAHILEVKKLYWQNNRELIQSKVVNNRDKIRKIKLDSGCVDCGYNQHFAALDFDHVNGEKYRVVSDLTGYRWGTVLAEIEKCEVRCANCHRIKTYKDKQSEFVP